MKIMLTGGAGYIGTHTLVEVLRENHLTMVFDNFSNASHEGLARVKRLTNRDFEIREGDLCDNQPLLATMRDFLPDVVIHFAGLKAVGESEGQPLTYYKNNVFGAIQLLEAMDQVGCKNIVFSSTATVYGSPKYLPYDENHPLNPESPYGRSKLMVEQLIQDWCAATQGATGVILRYFNPVGAHDSGEIGEDPLGYPNNLMPFVQQVAIGRRERVFVHGDDYQTSDGTGVRDYIHIDDLARAHLAAVNFTAERTGTHIFNIGTGRGYSVLEMIHAFEKATGKPIPYIIGPRRTGDIAEFTANPNKANKLLGWEAKLDIDDMCQSAWQFQSKNPAGYAK